MKSGTSNTILTVVLAVLLLADVLFALRAIIVTREIRRIQAELLEHQTNLNRAGLLFNDALIYGKTHPDISPILKPLEAKPATH